MPKGAPNKRYTGEFKQLVVETMMKERRYSACAASGTKKVSPPMLDSRFDEDLIAKTSVSA